ncbi:hypothetical protein WBG78_07050 [Chryseolinea sp. T2]|uniref:hypothetical protein n=1 Tax=Chryseolinea sp. T2 TaxID=3129255 RepID=UPI003077ECCC
MSRLKVSGIFSLVFAFSLSLSLQSCVVHTKTTPSASKTHVPPGQAKKATGSQSAKQYAPGQQKKKN